MNKKKKKIIRIVLIAALVLIVAAIVVISILDKDRGVSQFYVENTDYMEFNPYFSTESRLDNSLLEYGKVLTKYKNKGYDVPYTGDPIVIDLSSITGTDDGNELIKFADSEAYDTEVGGIKYLDHSTEQNVTVDCSMYPDAFYCSEGNTEITFYVNIETAGTYSMNIDYLMLDAKDTDMYVGLYIDNKLPFVNASNMSLKRMFAFYNTEVSENLDKLGNQIRPKQQEVFGWQTETLSNPEGVYKNPYRFYLKAGEHKFVMKFYNQPGAIGSISLVAPLVSPSYEEYVAANGGLNNIYSGKSLQFELEGGDSCSIDYTSSVSIRMEYDNDYASYPQSFNKTRYNVFGGERWSSGGDGAQWSFEVPEDGWYKLGFRYQSITTNVASYKEIKIDGVIPFEEVEEYCFPYSNYWIGDCVKNADNEPYYFYLTAGTHTITLTNKVGPLRHTYQRLSESIESITDLVNQIAKITASTRSSSGGYVVDRNRDYDLDKYIPDIEDTLTKYKETFKECYNDIKAANGGELPSYGSAVKVAYELFVKLNKDLEDVPVSLNDISDALTGLSNTLVAIREQPITMDYMVLSDSKENYAKAVSNTWQNIYVGIIRFKNTFGKDYSSVGTRKGVDDSDMVSIEVYVSRGREYVDILKNMVAEQFTPEYNVKVNVNMVAGSSEGLIMKRYVAGTAPDAAISIGAATPFEFAVRGALEPLEQFTSYTKENGTQVLGFEDLMNKSFYWETLTPLIYQGHTYGLPETQSWAALFYRTDILAELDVNPPDTWDDIYALVPILSNEGYSFYYPYGVGNYSSFLYQRGGTFFDEDGIATTLDTNAAYDAFVEYADLYLQYNFVYAADFYMRFKSGEMPLGIADMSFYCKLKYSAPELNGKWDILPVPGHYAIDENGNAYVRRDTGAIGSVNIIVHRKKGQEEHYKESWEFLQWWMSDEVQEEYGREVEATFGVASRWNPANKAATASLPYTQSELEVIFEQWEHIKETPSVLGGYYLSRYLVTALNQTVLQGQNARIALEDAIKEIDKEMHRKQVEYGIDAENGGSVIRASSSAN